MLAYEFFPDFRRKHASSKTPILGKFSYSRKVCFRRPHDVINYPGRHLSKFDKTAENAACDGFGSNFSGAQNQLLDSPQLAPTGRSTGHPSGTFGHERRLRHDHDVLLCRLETSFGVCGTAPTWFQSFISGRSQAVSFNGSTSTYTPVRPPPQGPFSDLCCSCCTLLTSFHLPLYMASVYADDAQLYVSKCSAVDASTSTRSTLTPQMGGGVELVGHN